MSEETDILDEPEDSKPTAPKLNENPASTELGPAPSTMEAYPQHDSRCPCHCPATIPRRSSALSLSLEGRGASTLPGVSGARQPRSSGQAHHGQSTCLGVDRGRISPYRRRPHGSDSRRQRRLNASHQKVRSFEKRAVLCLCRLVVTSLHSAIPAPYLSTGQGWNDPRSTKAVL